jgi:hypothetical protein
MNDTEDLQAYAIALGEQLELLNESLSSLPAELSKNLSEQLQAVLPSPVDTTNLEASFTQGSEGVIQAIKEIKTPEAPNKVDFKPIISKLDEYLFAMQEIASKDAPEAPEKIDLSGMTTILSEIKKALTEPHKEELKPLIEDLIKAVKNGGQKVIMGGGSMGDAEKDAMYRTRDAVVAINTKVATEQKQDDIITNQTDGSQKTQIVGPNGTAVNVDGVGALEHITGEHHQIHAGTSFYYDDLITLGAGVTQDYLITADSLKSHWGYLIDGAFGITIELFEATDKTGTTLQTAYNRNRNSSITPTTTTHKGISGGTTDGTRIVWRRSGTGAVGGKLSGTSTDASERILKMGTKYILRITSAAVNNEIALQLNWYEV